MNYNALATELALTAYADLSDVEAAALLNTETVDSNQPISSTELLAWAGQAGRYAKIDTAANNAGLSNEVRSVAMAARKLIDRDGTALDLSLPDRAAMLSGLVASGILTADDKASLESLATVQVSRATELGLGRIKRGYVQRARARLGE